MTSLSYQWLRDNTELIAETNDVLVITNSQPALAGAYTVRVSTAWGLATNLTTILYVISTRPMGTVVAWGSDTNVPAGLSGVVAISAGQGYSLALRADGTVIAWGQSAPVPPVLRDVV